jgi:hypothetical protein
MLQQQLDATTLATAWAEGRTMSLEQALLMAQRVTG